MDELKIQWHSAFCSAMELILEQDREHLEFIREYNLNTKPLEVDLMVIKKPAGYRVSDEIGRIFKEHNIFEYKSPDDKMNIDTFYKVNAYACLYKVSGSRVDEIRSDNVTITLIRESKPEKLLRKLEREGFAVSNPYKGIYYIEDKVYFSTQIVVSKELEGEQHIWLQALTKKLDREDAENLILQTQHCISPGKRRLADAVLTVSVKANNALFGNVKEDANMFEVLKELMADEIRAEVNAGIAMGEMQAEKRGEEIGEKRGREIGAEKGLKALAHVLKEMGLDFDSAYCAIIKTEAYQNVSRDQVSKYWK